MRTTKWKKHGSKLFSHHGRHFLVILGVCLFSFWLNWSRARFLFLGWSCALNSETGQIFLITDLIYIPLCILPSATATSMHCWQLTAMPSNIFNLCQLVAIFLKARLYPWSLGNWSWLSSLTVYRYFIPNIFRHSSVHLVYQLCNIRHLASPGLLSGLKTVLTASRSIAIGLHSSVFRVYHPRSGLQLFFQRSRP